MSQLGVMACPFFIPTQGLIFVVDSNDRERVQESADELQKMVSTQSPGNRVPVQRQSSEISELE